MSLAVVFVHYRLPEHRLQDHFRWNAAFYQRPRVRVFVVTDVPRALPPYATCLVYPKPMKIFSLATTKNFGLQTVLAHPEFNHIAVTDADIAWSVRSFMQCVACSPREVIAPIYLMARTYETRQEEKTPDYGCTGTLCMHSQHWRRVRYDERYVGYGGEDGKVLKEIMKLKLKQNRLGTVHHIAHDPTADQTNIPGHGRVDAWNRDSGFNPDMFHINKGLY